MWPASLRAPLHALNPMNKHALAMMSTGSQEQCSSLPPALFWDFGFRFFEPRISARISDFASRGPGFWPGFRILPLDLGFWICEIPVRITVFFADALHCDTRKPFTITVLVPHNGRCVL